LGALLLAACDTMYGIDRRTTFTAPIDWVCAEEALKSVGTIEDVQRDENETVSFGIAPRWGEITTANRMIFYNVPGVAEVLIQSHTEDGEEDLSWMHTHWQLNRPVPAQTIEALRPVMLTVEGALSERCSMDFANTTETVRGTKKVRNDS